MSRHTATIKFRTKVRREYEIMTLPHMVLMRFASLIAGASLFQDETGLDCGGSFNYGASNLGFVGCKRCLQGEVCLQDSDCAVGCCAESLTLSVSIMVSRTCQDECTYTHACPAGFYNPSQSALPEGCEACPLGQYYGGGTSATCFSCPSGKSMVNSTQTTEGTGESV